MWSLVNRKVGDLRENELRNSTDFWKGLIDQGARFERFQDDYESAKNIALLLLDNKPMTLQIQLELAEPNKGLRHTHAGQEVRNQLRIHRQELKRQMKDLGLGWREENITARREKIRLKTALGNIKAQLAVLDEQADVLDISRILKRSFSRGRLTLASLPDAYLLICPDTLEDCLYKTVRKDKHRRDDVFAKYVVIIHSSPNGKLDMIDELSNSGHLVIKLEHNTSDHLGLYSFSSSRIMFVPILGFRFSPGYKSLPEYSSHKLIS